jgi:hypothetical protein
MLGLQPRLVTPGCLKGARPASRHSSALEIAAHLYPLREPPVDLKIAGLVYMPARRTSFAVLGRMATAQ